MYLIILEDGEVFKSKDLPEQELENADNGLLEVISIGGPQPTRYIGGEWFGINELPEYDNTK